MTNNNAVVEMNGISIEFPGVKALDCVNLRLLPGEVHALMGENGAGKSTLIKALTGVYTIDSGSIAVEGKRLTFTGPGEAQEAGIATVYQEVNLCENLTVAENIMLSHAPRRGGAISWPEMRRQASVYLERMNLDINPASVLSSHSIAVQQLVAICRAMVVDAKVLILDEPTSSLDSSEVAQLFQVMRSLRESGVAILFVSHFLDQIYEIADRMTVLRNGQLVGEYCVADIPQLELVSKMIGKSLQQLEDIEATTARPVIDTSEAIPVLSAIGVGRRGYVEPFDLDVYAGEIVGLAGLLGSGRTELVRLLYAADRSDTGKVLLGGKEARIRSPRSAMQNRMAFSSENRKGEGLIADLTVRENIMLGLQADRGWARRISRRKTNEVVDKYIAALNIRPANPDALVRNLSGGNQQKVLLARWMATSPKLLILDEPTRGIDVGAKAEIQRHVAELSAEGMSVIFISAELEEVLRLSQRIAVMRDHHKIGEVINSETVTLDNVVEMIASGGEQQ